MVQDQAQPLALRLRGAEHACSTRMVSERGSAECGALEAAGDASRILQLTPNLQCLLPQVRCNPGFVLLPRQITLDGKRRRGGVPRTGHLRDSQTFLQEFRTARVWRL